MPKRPHLDLPHSHRLLLPHRLRDEYDRNENAHGRYADKSGFHINFKTIYRGLRNKNCRASKLAALSVKLN